VLRETSALRFCARKVQCKSAPLSPEAVMLRTSDTPAPSWRRRVASVQTCIGELPACVKGLPSPVEGVDAVVLDAASGGVCCSGVNNSRIPLLAPSLGENCVGCLGCVASFRRSRAVVGEPAANCCPSDIAEGVAAEGEEPAIGVAAYDAPLFGEARPNASPVRRMPPDGP